MQIIGRGFEVDRMNQQLDPSCGLGAYANLKLFDSSFSSETKNGREKVGWSLPGITPDFEAFLPGRLHGRQGYRSYLCITSIGHNAY